MLPRPLEVYQIRARYRNSWDPRPCVVLDPPLGDTVSVALVSGAMDLYDSTVHFLIEQDHPDFPATGLQRTSYVAGDMIVEAEIGSLLRKRGQLEGELGAAFRKWIGIP